ncbi:MAG: hypothetical protein V7668_16135 [Cereibacter changlensis]
MRLTLVLLVILAGAVALMLLAGGPQATALAHWAAEQQRGFQNAMAGSLQALKAGDPAALATLCFLSASYGFVHALGPGHGKVLLGGAALAGGAGLWRMLWLSLVSALAQSLTAILLVVVGVKLLALTSTEAIGLTEDWLAPASYAAVALIGGMLAFRGGRALLRQLDVKREAHAHHHHHWEDCGCGHSHGPTPAAVAALTSKREMAGLIASIALRPCTGALFLLVIAWRFDIAASGMLAVLAMGVGTALFNGLVVGGGVGLRQLARVAGGAAAGRMQTVSAALQLVTGGAIMALMLAMILGRG